MKKITLLFILFTTICLSQQQVEKFELKVDGFPDYVVLEFDGKTANDIYVQVQKWAQYNIRNAEYSNYSEIQDEYLTYTIKYPNAFDARNTLGPETFEVLMDVELRFRDGKLRIDLHPKRIKSKNGMELGFSGGLSGILKKNGKQRKYNLYKDAFVGINNLANLIVSDFENAVNGTVDYKKSDW